MGLTVKQENNFGSLFDKFASLPSDVKKDMKSVDEADKKNKNSKKKQEHK